MADQTGSTLFLNSVASGSLAMVKYMVEDLKADINQVRRRRIMMGNRRRRIDDSGVSVDRHGFGGTVTAAYLGHDQVLKYLMKHPGYK